MKKNRKLNLGKITIASINNSYRIKGGTAVNNIETNTCGCPATINENTCAPSCNGCNLIPGGGGTTVLFTDCEPTSNNNDCETVTVTGTTNLSAQCMVSAGCIG